MSGLVFGNDRCDFNCGNSTIFKPIGFDGFKNLDFSSLFNQVNAEVKV